MSKKTKLAIYGAVIGDYYGSFWEFRTNKPKDLKDAITLREDDAHEITDDTVMTCAVAEAILNSVGSIQLSEKVSKTMRKWGKNYPTSYGLTFDDWIYDDTMGAYNSFGNGCAMRISPVGLAYENESVKVMSRAVTEVTHNHPFGVFYSEVVARLISLCKQPKCTKQDVINFLKKEYPSVWNEINGMTIRKLHKEYSFTETVQDTVPQAIKCFLASKNFSNCLATSLYIGGDSDTLSAIACSIGAPFYGDGQVKAFVEKVPLPTAMKNILDTFSQKYL